MTKLVISTLLLFLAAPAFADAVAEPSTGVTFDANKTVDGKSYLLTGTGVRKKFIVKVYAFAMYVEQAQAKRDYLSFVQRKDANANQFLIWGAFDKMAIMHFVRDVGIDKIREAFHEGLGEELSANAPADEKKATEDFLGLLNKDIKDGEEIVLRTSGDGKISLKIGAAPMQAGPQNVKLTRALWSIWFGSKPISSEIKKGAVSRLDMLNQ